MILLKKFNQQMLNQIHFESLQKGEGYVIPKEIKACLYEDIVKNLYKKVNIHPMIGKDIELEFYALTKIFVENVNKDMGYERYFSKSDLMKIEECLLKNKDIESLGVDIYKVIDSEDFNLDLYEKMRKIDSIRNSLVISNYELVRIAREMSSCRIVTVNYTDGEEVSYSVKSDSFERECVNNIVYQMNPKLVIGAPCWKRQIDNIVDLRGRIIVEFKEKNRYIV